MSAIADMTGMRFGRLLVQRLSPERDKHRRAIWECQCDCGAIVRKPLTALRSLERLGQVGRCGSKCPLRAADYYESRTCIYCQREYQPAAKNQTMCGSPECLQRFRREWKRRNYKRKAPPPRNCLICAEPFQPIRANNVVCSDRECRLEHKRRLAAERSAGVLRPGDTEIYCVICGDPVMAHHNTVTCAKRDCILERRRRTSRKTKGLQPCRCIVCSTPFWPADRGPGQHYTCSGKCSRIARLRRNRRTYTANRDERLRKLAERLATDPAFRERRRQVDRDSRQRRNATKLLGDLSKVQNTLEEKLSNA